MINYFLTTLSCIAATIATAGYVTGYRDYDTNKEPLYRVPLGDAGMFPRLPGMAIRAPDNTIEYIPRSSRATHSSSRNSVSRTVTNVVHGSERPNRAPTPPGSLPITRPIGSATSGGYVTGYRDYDTSREPLYQVPVGEAQRFPRLPGMAIRGPDNTIEYIPTTAATSRAASTPRQSTISSVSSTSGTTTGIRRSSSRSRDRPLTPVSQSKPSRNHSRSPRRSSLHSSDDTHTSVGSQISCDPNRPIQTPPMSLEEVTRYLSRQSLGSSSVGEFWSRTGGPQLVYNLVCSDRHSSSSLSNEERIDQLKCLFLIASRLLDEFASRETSHMLESSRQVCKVNLKHITKFLETEYRNGWIQSRLVRLGTPDSPHYNLNVICPELAKNDAIMRYIVLQRVVRSLKNRPRRVAEMTVSRDRIFAETVGYLGTFALSPYTGFYIRIDREIGQDLGGVTAEWMALFGKALVKEGYMVPTSGGYMVLNLKKHNGHNSAVFVTLGRMLAISLLTDTYMGIPFSLGLAKYLAGEKVLFADLSKEDPDLYRQLNRGTDELIALDLSFSATDRLGKDHDLIPGGSKIMVNRQNVNQWRDAMAKWYMVGQFEKEGLANVKMGFESLLDFKLVFGPTLRAKDIVKIFSGNLKPKVEDIQSMIVFGLERRTVLSPSRQEELSRWIMNLLASLSSDELVKFMMFATASPVVDYRRIAIVFENFSLREQRNDRPANWMGKNDDSFPQTHTCTRQIDVPIYSTLEILKRRFITALKHGLDNVGRV